MTYLELLKELKNGPTDTLINQAASIFECFYKNQDHGFVFKELSSHKFTNLEVEELVNELISIASFENTYQSGAIWALGKTCKEDLVPTIIAIAKKSDDDNVVYQSLICIEDCIIGCIEDDDITKAWKFIHSISLSGTEKSKEHALQMLKFKKYMGR